MAETLTTGKCSALVIGGSAGSLDVLLEVFPGLSSQINFPIILVTHRKSGNDSLLTDLLKSRTRLTVTEAEEKQKLLPGYVYIVPADYHLLFESKNTVSLDSSEKMNYSRPSIDVTFKSAAEIFGENLIGVLLSGANADGVEGLKYIKKNKGKVWIQNPETAEVDYMPKQAVGQVDYDLLIEPRDLAELINQL